MNNVKNRVIDYGILDLDTPVQPAPTTTTNTTSYTNCHNDQRRYNIHIELSFGNGGGSILAPLIGAATVLWLLIQGTPFLSAFTKFGHTMGL